MIGKKITSLYSDPMFDRKIGSVTAGLKSQYINPLRPF
jgi:hypothetical protein